MVAQSTLDDMDVAWSDDDASTSSDFKFITANADGTMYTEHPKERSKDDPKKRAIFRPQVTVNVFNGGGPNGGGASASGPNAGGSGSAGPGTSGHDTGAASNDAIVKLLATQLAALSEKVEKLSLELAAQRPSDRGLVLDTGVWDTAEVRTYAWKTPRRVTSGRVTFSKKFEQVPTVTASISHADMDKDRNFRLRVFVTDVDLKGFTAHAHALDDTILYGCGVSWMAIGK
ncbi:hypothetical protein F4804DRAFT_92110 [Jackrogersella minutella]|nr:hypothetical protein F4804DRAFT_92110 [Jackrogersella minutella]